MEQSMKKPKFIKNRTRTDFEIYRTANENQEKHPPIAIDHIIAQMRKMNPQDVINLLIPSN